MSERNPDSGRAAPHWYLNAWGNRYVQPQFTPTSSAPQWHCPDLLRYEQIGAADGPRGHVVRAFFWIMRAWPPSRARG